MLNKFPGLIKARSDLLHATWKYMPGEAFDIQRDTFWNYVEENGVEFRHIVFAQSKEGYNERN